MKILVTGASGFIGSHLVEKLSQAGHEVFALLRRSSKVEHLSQVPYTRVEGDLQDPESLAKAVRGMDVIFHLAGATASKDRAGYFRNNAKGTMHLAQAAAKESRGLKRFIYVSSLAAAGPARSLRPRTESENEEPVSAYGESKLQGEKELLAFKADYPVTIIRPPVVYGPRDTGVFLIIQSVARRIAPVMKGAAEDGQKHYSIVHVHDLVQGLISCISPEGLALKSGEVFYFSNSLSVTMDEILSAASAHLQRKPLRIPIPRSLLKAVAASMTGFSKLTGIAFPLNNDKVNEILPDYWLCSNSKAEKSLGFKPQHDLFSGMGDTVRWYREEKWL